jgi:hypothetical protein
LEKLEQPKEACETLERAEAHLERAASLNEKYPNAQAIRKLVEQNLAEARRRLGDRPRKTGAT